MPIKYPTTSKTLLEKIASGDKISWEQSGYVNKVAIQYVIK